MVAMADKTETARLYELLSSVADPEIPVLTLQDLGVLRDVSVAEGKVTVTITPTYAGCPAMDTMRADIESTLARAGYSQVSVQQTLSPAWTTDWMTPAGREKLRAYGIAPPLNTGCGQADGCIECPQCNSSNVKKISEFGSTACKALFQCQDCREPFDYFKYI
jgi:ring-1,2-phenylacetyl-CoA epoxidase subunit PaaD